ncbi:MAG: hypothetical protein JNK15_02300 [Planctomycetes bacterium]|nr:hypothetical protein [Planctomycetota bacterium]
MSLFGLTRRRRTVPMPRSLRIVRGALFVAVAVVAWLLVARFRVWQVPLRMDTDPAVPAGAYVLVDRQAQGLRVGSRVFVATPRGEVVSQVATWDGTMLTVAHANPRSSIPDSSVFGPLPRDAVLGLVLSVFAAGDPEPTRGR